MCKLKPHMVEEPKPLRSSHIKNPSTSTDISGGSSLFSRASTSTCNSLASLKDSLPENHNLYRYKELADATNQFDSGRMGKLSVWKCVLRGKSVAVTVRRQKRKKGDFRSGLREIRSAHHASIVKLLGGCCEGQIVYLVYEYVKGSSLADCLSSKAPAYTVLGSCSQEVFNTKNQVLEANFAIWPKQGKAMRSLQLRYVLGQWTNFDN